MSGPRRRVVWTEAATKDFEEILTYVAVRSGMVAAQRLHDKLDKAIAAHDRAILPGSLCLAAAAARRTLAVAPSQSQPRSRSRAVVAAQS